MTDRIPTIEDAIRLAGRAAYYHRIFLGETIPDYNYPEELWDRRQGYYANQALALSCELDGLARTVMTRALLGSSYEYGEEARRITPAQVLEGAERAATNQQVGERVRAHLLLDVERQVDRVTFFGAETVIGVTL